MNTSLRFPLSFFSILKYIGVYILVSLSININAQSILSLDTVHVGDMVSFDLSGDDKFQTYAWEFESNTFRTLLTTSAPVPNTGTNGAQFDISSGSTITHDALTKSYYGFVACASSGFSNPNVQRIDFGINPNNPNPTIVNLGNPSNAFIDGTTGYTNMQDMKVVKDEAGTYHGFINNGGIVHWVFGNGLNNPPTIATRIFTNPSVLRMSMNMAVLKYNGNWYLFTGQAFGNNPGLVRLDLGSNLNTIPGNLPFFAFPAISNLNDVAYLAILKENGNWFINMCALDGAATMIQYSFGANLINNNPTIVNLGGINPNSSRNRGLNFLKTCDTTVLIGCYENGTIYKFNYANNSVTNNLIPHNLGQKFGTSVAMQNLSPYWYKDTLWTLTTSYNNNSNNVVYRFPLAAFNSNNTSINYYKSAASHTFNTTGTFDVQLYCDQGENRGPQSFCKQIVVVNNPTATENIVAATGSVAVYPNPATDELNIKLPASGNFSYIIFNALGQIVSSGSNKQIFSNQGNQLNLRIYTLIPGVYYLNLIAENGNTYSAKFIKR